jgi:3-oxoadipate enol-lactonase
MKFTEKKINAGKITTSYYDEGEHDAPCIIFIHGFPFNKAMWENQVNELKDQYRAIAYDVRGHGSSESGTQLFSMHQFAADLFSFMDALNIKRAVVCGLSMGGYIALNALQQQPDRIAALILADTQCAADSEEGRKKRMETIDAIRKNGLFEYASNSIKKLFTEWSLTSKKDEVRFIEQTILRTDAETICNTLQALADRKETCTVLPQVTIPVLILVGQDDQITPPEAAQKMHNLVTQSTLKEIDQAGHLTNLENPERFNQHIKSFLSSLV